MARVNGVHDLPGFPLGAVDPQAPAREVVPAYFAEYELRLGMPVRRPVVVHDVRPAGARLLVTSSAGTFAARAVVNATGTWTRPFWPSYPGRGSFRGRQLHTADYAGPQEFTGQHVVVVGGGISAVQHLEDLAAHGVGTTWVTRHEPVFREDFDVEARRAAVEVVAQRVAAGEPPGSVVSATGLLLTPEVAALRDRGVLKRHPRSPASRPTASSGPTAPGRARTRSCGPPGSARPWTTSAACTCANPAAASSSTAPAWSANPGCTSSGTAVGQHRGGEPRRAAGRPRGPRGALTGRGYVLRP